VPRERRGEGLGYFGLSGNLALAVGPALGLFLVDHIRFSSLFLICGSLTLIALLLALTIKYKKVEPETKMSQENKVVEKSRMQVVEKLHLPLSHFFSLFPFPLVGLLLSFQHSSSKQDFRPIPIHYSLAFTP